MRRNTFLFGLAMLGVGVAVGGVFASLLGGRDPASTSGTSAPAPAAGAAAGAGGEGVAPLPAPSPGAAPARPPAGAPGPRSPVAPAGEGNGTLSGAVLGPGGAPLSGVLVRATPMEFGGEEESEEDAAPLPPPGSPPPPRDVDAVVRAFARGLERELAGLRETVTDAGGAYLLSGLPAKTYQLEAWLTGYEIARTGGDPWEPVPVGTTCDFLGVPLFRITAAVTLPDGTAPAHARISWTPEGDGEEGSAEWRPSAPTLDVKPGTYEFTASAAGPGERLPFTGGWIRSGRRFVPAEDDALYRSPPQTASVGAEGSPPLSFRLEGQPGILVKVVFAGAERPRSLRIAALRLEGAASGDPSQLLDDAAVKAVWIDDASEGSLVGLDPGTWLVGVTFRGGRVGPTATVVVGSGLVTKELLVPDGDLRDWIRVWVRGPDGSPVRDVSLECGCRSGEGNGSADLNTVPEADGSFRVEHFEQDSPSRGNGWSFGGNSLGAEGRTYFVKATSAKYGSAEATYDPATDRETTIQFVAPALLRVTVPGLGAGADRSRASLSLEAVGEEGGGRGRNRGGNLDGEIDASGVATFPPATPGAYEVVLRLAPTGGREAMRFGRWNSTEVARVPVTLGAGETTISVPLPSLSNLTVTFEGEAPELQRVSADGAGRSGRAVRGAEKEGEITFHDIAAGRYRLVDDRRGEMLVDVPTAGTVAFRPRPYDAFHIEIIGKGYLAELGLRTGDLVISIDGAEFRDRATLDAAMAVSKTRETSKFTILRDGATFDVTADGKRFEEDKGSYYRPWTR